jgi:hypothetical protein
MMNHRFLQSEGWLLLFALIFILPSMGYGVESPTAMTVRESGSYLYARQDVESHKIAALQKGETLTPLAEAVGAVTWYMVKTERGLVGWVRAGDVDLSGQLQETFREEQVSIWNARTGTGRIYEGTWTVEPNATPGSASGTWTLRTDTGLTILRGIWSADKFSTGWHGVWRATAEDGQKEFTGSWSADFPDVREGRFADLFAAAARQAIRGIWTGGAQSGSWSIRAVK